LPAAVRTSVTFADVAAKWLRFIKEDRERKPSTVSDYAGVRRPADRIDHCGRDRALFEPTFTAPARDRLDALLVGYRAKLDGLHRQHRVPSTGQCSQFSVVGIPGVPSNPAARRSLAIASTWG
jgi:hypothetical protein